jgi:hypothetical protein
MVPLCLHILGDGVLAVGIHNHADLVLNLENEALTSCCGNSVFGDT